MADPLTFVLPLPPNLANARLHWRKKHRERKAYMAQLDALWLARQLPAVPLPTPQSVTLESHLYVWSFLDDDNALARIKYAADWLVRAGYLVDDKRPHCRFTIPEQTVDRKAQRLEITLRAA